MIESHTVCIYCNGSGYIMAEPFKCSPPGSGGTTWGGYEPNSNIPELIYRFCPNCNGQGRGPVAELVDAETERGLKKVRQTCRSDELEAQ